MHIVVWVVIFLLIVTKLCDVLSTLREIHHASNESNPFAQKIMRRMGTKQAVWLVFLLAILIIAITGITALTMGVVFQVVFTVFGLFVSIVQLAVAIANWTGRDNMVSTQVRKVHWKVRMILPGG